MYSASLIDFAVVWTSLGPRDLFKVCEIRGSVSEMAMFVGEKFDS